MASHTRSSSNSSRGGTSLALAFVAAVIALCFGPASVQGAALTTYVEPGERSCYYAWVDQVGEKVGWYFAVQSGGDFEIEWTVTAPSNKVVVEGTKDRQADLVFTAQEEGEYAFCFQDPNFSAIKTVDFDITVESEPRLTMPLSQAAQLSEHSAPLEQSIGKVSEQLVSIARTQRYFRTWENRGFDTVRNTANKLFYFSVIESLLMIVISFGQVSLIRWLFERKGARHFRV